MKFEDVPDRNDLKQTFISNLKQNRLSHALLFSGIEGSGQFAFALALIQYLFCENKQEKDSCGTCHSCLKISKMQHPDVHFFFPYAKTKEQPRDFFIPIFRNTALENPFFSPSDWVESADINNKILKIYREDASEIIKILNFKAYEGHYRVVVIWLAEYLQSEGANALLKSLEEPGEKVLFILITHQADELLPTILSRCQPTKFTPYEAGSIENFIKEKYSLANEQAKEIARMADGNLSKAIQLADKGLNNSYLDFFKRWMRSAWAFNVPELITLQEEFSKTGKEKQIYLFDYCLFLLRESLLMHFVNQHPLTTANNEEYEFLTKFHLQINEYNIQDLIQLISESSMHIERNANARILFMDISAKIAKMLRQKT
jgi:DNA polymerase-3 subunit delta'